jgi:hypothetical protein
MKTVGTQFCSSLTKRELFAAITMSGLLASPGGSESYPEALAQVAIRITDALISELNNTSNEKQESKR